MRVLLAIFIGVAGVANSSADTRFEFSEPPGQYAVGFRVVRQYDSTRTFLGRFDVVTGEGVPPPSRARPIETLIWYPATQAGARMRYGDYLLLTGSEDRFDRSDAQIKAMTDYRLRDYLPPEMPASTVEQIKQESMWATQDANAAAGKFPIVIYAPSHNASAYENADLCEYLASHGYIVVASASMGADNRWMGEELGDVQAQVGDIEFLVGYAAGLANADSAHIAVIGYSWGGISNVFAAAKDSRITALVGFDGGIRLVGKLVSEAKYVTPEHITIPFLYLSSRPISIEDLYRQKQDLSDDLLARLKYSDLTIITFDPLMHYHFASEHLRFLSLKDPMMFPGDYALDEVFRAYGWVARYTLAFLDGEFKNDKKSSSFVTNEPATNGLPAHEIKIEVNRSTGMPATRETLAAEINRKGFSHAVDVYDAMKKQNADFKLPPYEFINWIDDLLVMNRAQEAIYIAQLFAKAYPDRPGPHVELGEAYLAHGDRALAVESFKKYLAMVPDDKRVQARLKEAETGKRQK